MEIRNVRHKGLRRFVELDDSSALSANSVEKIGHMVSFLQDAASVSELATIPTWRAHQLTGDRKGTWALHVTRNWRLTFRVEPSGSAIFDLDLEDYH